MPDGSWPIGAAEQAIGSPGDRRRSDAGSPPSGPQDDGFARQAAEMAYRRARRDIAPELEQLRAELEKRDALLRMIAEADLHWAPRIALVAAV